MDAGRHTVFTSHMLSGCLTAALTGKARSAGLYLGIGTLLDHFASCDRAAVLSRTLK